MSSGQVEHTRPIHSPSLPASLTEIPFEYFGVALDWLRAQPAVDPDAIGVMGISRGGELALLLGATFSQIHAIVAYAPSGVVWGRQPHGGEKRSAWSIGGNPLESLVMQRDPIDWATEPIVLTPGYLAALADAEAVEAATIPVERSNGSIFIVSGQADALWPSSELAEIAVSRLRRGGFGFSFEHVSYPDAGHSLGLPHLPATVLHGIHPIAKQDFLWGGTPSGTAHARADSWVRVLSFLQTQLACDR